MANNEGKINMSEWYAEVLDRTDIVKLISSYTPVEKKGSNYWACCPFHIEKTPSFQISGPKQLYYCFGCKASGNAISFVRHIESLEGFEAAKVLAEAAGMPIPHFSNRNDSNNEEVYAQKRARLYSLMRDAAKCYHENLTSGRASEAMYYLNKRGIDRQLITKFGLGYSLGGNNVIDYLKSRGYTEQEMKEAGIAEISERGWYDVFYDRLMIPIINNFKEVVGFGGRTLKSNPDFAKYRNTSQTIIFNKSKLIYGINLLKAKKQRDGIKSVDSIIICEGYMDVIALHKAGFDTAVASMGTALTQGQAKQLKFFCDKVYISYDGDFAGQEATMRGLDILSENGLNVKVVSLPDGMDPDDVINMYGREEYERLLNEAKTLTAFKIDVLKRKYNFDDMDEKAKFAVEAIRVIKALGNPVEIEQYLSIVQELTGYSMTVLLAQAQIVELPEQAKLELVIKQNQETKISEQSNCDKIKEYILASLAEKKDYIDYTENFSELLSDPFYSSLADYIVNCYNEGKTLSSIYEGYSEDNKTKINDILNYKFENNDNKVEYYKQIKKLKISNLTNQSFEYGRLADNLQGNERYDMINKITQINKKIAELNRLNNC